MLIARPQLRAGVPSLQFGEMPLTKKSVEVIAELYEALARRDLPAMMNLIDPDIIVSQTRMLPWGGEYYGVEGVQKFFTQLFSYVESQLAVDEFVDAGDRVIVIGSTRGRVLATGAQFNLRAVHVWTVKGGRGIRFEPNVDTPKMLAALGSVGDQKSEIRGQRSEFRDQ